ncbi:hypothetical protein [Gilliamella apis]|uniref:hypothetical protein n=1 Tax=Gilliamella apis TaxID=1970738 RepID=UPI00080DE725|nr:hypothetical protein [Gilliamella apis]OCG02505.1 hypothetical protein A9G19_06150 [Gilliamella apis]
MKNLTIKKVALGLFLAGYAASSAYAVDIVGETVNQIQGNAPVIFAKDHDIERAITIRITEDTAGNTAPGSDKKAKVGDYIHIWFNLKDSDGDIDSTGEIKDTLRVWINRTNDNVSWTNVTSDISSSLTYNNTGEEGHIYFRITEAMAGAVKVGLQLQEKTTFGNPNVNEWLNLADIWSPQAPQHQETIGDDEKPAPDTGPGDADPNNPVGPIYSDESTKIGIFKYKTDGTLDMAINLSNLPAQPTGVSDADWAKRTVPQYGDRLGAVVWQITDGNTTGDHSLPNTAGTDRIITNSYNFSWYLYGTSSANTGSVAAPADALTTGVYSVAGTNIGDSIALGAVEAAGGNVATIANTKHNSLYSTLTTTKAGIQGFKLQVIAR